MKEVTKKKESEVWKRKRDLERENKSKRRCDAKYVIREIVRTRDGGRKRESKRETKRGEEWVGESEGEENRENKSNRNGEE